MKKSLFLATMVSSALFASQTPLHVELDIYTNKLFLNKTFELSESGSIEIQVPAYTKAEQLRYELDKSCQIDSEKLSSVKEIQEGSELKELKQAYENLELQINRLYAKSNLIKSIKLEKSTDFEQVSTFMMEELRKNDSEITSLKNELELLSEKIHKTQRVNNTYKSLHISFTCKENQAKMKLTYPLEKVGYNAFYDINANINNKSVTIEKKASIDYKGFEDFEEIDFNLYSYTYNQNVNPMKYYPRYIGGERPLAQRAKSMMAEATKTAIPIITHEDLTSKSVYRVQGAKLIYGEKNLLEVDAELVDANFKSVIDAYGTNRAYIEASFKSKKDYPAGIANYFFDTKPIASKHMPSIKKTETTKFYFGEDEHIHITKKLIETLNEKTFFGDKKISSQNWKYKITNTKPFSEQITLIERVPVSRDADISVTTSATPMPDTQSADGKTEWNFTLEGGKSKTIIFGYEVSKTK